MALCEFCGEHEAVELAPREAGPVHGEVLENYDANGKVVASHNFCSYVCWESDVKMKRKIKESK